MRPVHPLRHRLSTVAVSVLMAAGATSAAAQSTSVDARLERLAAQIEALQNELKSLKAQPPAPAPAPAATATASATGPKVITEGDLPNSFKLPGTNTSVRIGGKVQVDFIKDISGGGIGGTASNPAAIPFAGTAQVGRGRSLAITPRQSRLIMETLTPTSLGNVKVWVEGDFYGFGGNELVTNSSAFRLRHAYAEIGPWLFGQFWTNWTNLPTTPETIDFGGPAGTPQGMRIPQIRYTQKIGPGALSVAVENPEADFVGAATQTLAAGTTVYSPNFVDTVPDLTARYAFGGDWGQAVVGAMARKLVLNNAGSTAINGFTGTAATWGYGLTAGARIKTIGKSGFIMSATGGSGLGRYITGAPLPSAAVVVNGELQAIRSWSTSLAYQHYWREDLRSTINWGHVKINNPHPAMPLNSISKQDLVHANLIWNPSPATTLGAEVLYGRVANDDVPTAAASNRGKATRVQMTAAYAF